MKRFSEFVFKYKKAVILLVILITFISGYFIKDLNINPDIISYLPKSDPVIKLFNHINEEYGSNFLAIVALQTDDIFNKETIDEINHLTQEFKKVEDVAYVTSLANVLDIRSDDEGTLQISRLIDEYNLPETPQDIHKLKLYTLSKDMYRGRLVSTDATATLIICRLIEGTDKMKTARQLKEIVRKSRIKEEAYYSGLPFQMMDISSTVQHEIRLLVPLVLILICISLLLTFRSLRGVILPILSVLISTIWTLGIMSILKVSLTVISDIIPIILIAVGSAYSIHVVSKFNEDVEIKKNRIKPPVKALSEVGIPVLFAAITTIAGFLSFIFGSYLTMIREFGIFSSMGILFALIISVTFVPSVLSSLPAKYRALSNNIEKGDAFTRFVDKVSKWILKNEKPIIVGGIIVLTISIIGIPKIVRKVDMLDYFKRGTPIRMTEEMMEEKFGGSVPIQILIKGDIQEPEVLKEMKKMEDFLESQKDVHNPQSVADLIEEMNDVMGEGKTIPGSKDKVSNLWFLLEGEEIMSQLVNQDKNEAVIQATIGSINTARMKRLNENIEKHINEVNDPNVIFAQSGIPPIYQKLDDSIVRSLIWSIIIALVLVFVCLVFITRSFIAGLIGLTPIGITLLIIFGFMGVSGIPLDIATVLVGSISIGIGVDYSIHIVTRFRKEFEKSSTTIQALDITLKTTGKAILINVITVTMGFLVLLLGDMVPMQRLGILIAITMIASGVSAITLLPAIILLTRAGFMNKKTNHLMNKQE